MAYVEINLIQARADLGRRLNDPNSVFWTDAEKTRYLYEANRTFGALANFYRENFNWSCVANTQWYDLTQVTGTLRPYTVTDLDLIQITQHHLLEPATGFTWTGSLQFNASDLLESLQRRRDQLLNDTGCRISQYLTPTVAGRKTLNDFTIDIRRVAWIPNANPTYPAVPLWSGDAWDIKSYERTPNVTMPSIYVRSTEPPLAFSPDVNPPVIGNYDVLTVESGPVLNGATPTILRIPDDWAWIVKWGALADLLSRESVARDPIRAQYCQSRYDHGVQVLKRAPALLGARIGSPSVILDTDSAQNMDNFRPSWQSQTPTRPDTLVIGGLNMVALAPTPNATYPLVAIVLQNTPIPLDPIYDFFQFGLEDYDAILNYAQHLASFKQGGAEFLTTMPLLKQFLEHVQFYNTKLSEFDGYTDEIFKISQLQEQSHPRTDTTDNVIGVS